MTDDFKPRKFEPRNFGLKLTPAEYLDKWKEHRKVENRYIKMMHTSIGKIWEIPDCCVAQFCEELCYGIAPAQYRVLKHNKPIPPGLDYVPCDECMKNF